MVGAVAAAVAAGASSSSLLTAAAVGDDDASAAASLLLTGQPSTFLIYRYCDANEITQQIAVTTKSTMTFVAIV